MTTPTFNDAEAEAAAALNLAHAVVTNLADQHNWTRLSIRPASFTSGSTGTSSSSSSTHSDTAGSGPSLCLRPLVRGLPPRRLYVHPDDQVAALAREEATGQRSRPDEALPEPEWVLPVHVSESWSIARFAAVFDSLESQGSRRDKRILLATLHNDSTVVYYFMQDGMVKPRQN